MLLSNAGRLCLALGNLECPPRLGPTEVKRAEAASPSRPACHTRGPDRAGNLFMQAPPHPMAIILLLLAQSKPLLWFQTWSYL